ncbi:hypothetical protein F3Y22_tig00111273pilonHSYRG00203 [Hibiscus syriacus]|uniref:DUF4057 domain-containing protein n=1 Tax=Hibiscus syriacus TaxID=106335 RepID=A0A6A2YS96_HIBSY|nr:hypothetical protein F3Y22_tig00111273pilonHSYRG00203 [Hibiscus syriacus]
MERSTPVRKPHTSRADMLTWFETPQPDYTSSASPAVGRDKIVVFGGQVIDEEFESLNKQKPHSGYKMKEMTGSGIFVARGENDESEPGSANPGSNNKTGTYYIRVDVAWDYQKALTRISPVSFAEEDNISPKKPTTLDEVAKQRELSGS